MFHCSISQHLSNKIDVKTLYIPSTQWEHARTLVRNRQQQISDSTRCKCRIWQFLYYSSLPIPDKAETGQYWSGKFITKLQQMDCNNSFELKAALDIKLQDYLHKKKLLLESTRTIRKMYRQSSFWPADEADDEGYVLKIILRGSMSRIKPTMKGVKRPISKIVPSLIKFYRVL